MSDVGVGYGKATEGWCLDGVLLEERRFRSISSGTTENVSTSMECICS